MDTGRAQLTVDPACSGTRSTARPKLAEGRGPPTPGEGGPLQNADQGASGVRGVDSCQWYTAHLGGAWQKMPRDTMRGARTSGRSERQERERLPAER